MTAGGQLFRLLAALVIIAGLSGCTSVRQNVGKKVGEILNGDPYYTIAYRQNTDTREDRIKDDITAEIRFTTNNYHVALRSPNGSQRVDSPTLEDQDDVWRHNGIELAYGTPLYQNGEDSLFYVRLDWELQAGLMFVTLNQAVVVSEEETDAGFERVIEQKRHGQDFHTVVGAGLRVTTGLQGMRTVGSRYESMGIVLGGGYRELGNFGTTPYFEAGVNFGF